MKDGIIKDAGKSRLIKAVFPATYEEFKKMAAAGTLPLDILFNADGWSQAPTFLNKANLLTDDTATLLGLTEEDPTVNGAFHLISGISWRKIKEYTAAGAYTWTAPDLNNGQPYKVGVWMCGGGGKGAAGVNGSSSAYDFATGGTSGYDLNITLTVFPGSDYNIVIGLGGGKGTDANGGTTSAFGYTAEGGLCGAYKDMDSYIIKGGGQPAGGSVSESNFNGGYGGVPVGHQDSSYYYTWGPGSQCFNQFEGKKKLGAGGNAYGRVNDSGNQASKGGKNDMGYGGGDGTIENAGNAVGENATEYGCGGGAAMAMTGYTATGGNGADGAIFIYFGGAA